MDILMVLATGLVIGIVAKFLMPGRDPGGIIVTTLIGIAGASVGGFLTATVGFGYAGRIPNFISAVIGAMLLLGAYRVIRKRR